jgi:hypothetical protein
MLSTRLAAVLGVALTAVCTLNAQTPPAEPTATPVQAAPSSAAATTPDLSGYWDFEVNVGQRITVGEMTLGKSGDGYLGTLTAKGTNTLAVRSFKLEGTGVEMIVESRDGDVTFKGTLDKDGTSMSGIVTYHHGEQFPMTTRKRQPAATS